MDRYRKGGPEDDVANNIRAQQQADAMPSASEAKAEHMKHLSDEGCEVCGEDDPAVLEEVYKPMHNCPDHQAPPRPETTVRCEEHTTSSEELREQDIQATADELEPNTALVVYECDIYYTVEGTDPEPVIDEIQVGRDENGDPVCKERVIAGPQRSSEHRPQLDAACRCGAPITAVHYREPES
jgi:hypothetical protein